jgi:hypothetical protein
MIGTRSTWRRLRHRLLGALAAPGLLIATADLFAQDGPAPPSALPAVVAPVDVPVLDLAACKAMALARQPALAAAQASYSAAIARQHGLETLRLPTFLVRDLKVRREQAAVGVCIAQAEVERVKLDTLYSVTFSYLSVQYAIEQRKLVDKAINGEPPRTGLEEFLKRVKTLNFRKEELDRVEAYLELARSRREETILGEERAKSALREAVAADPHLPLLLTATGQVCPNPVVSKDQLLADALTRRPEILQVNLLAQVHGLEVDAQGAYKLLLRVPTFASGSDIHVRPLPAGSYDERYKPAAVGPEMPPVFAYLRYLEAFNRLQSLEKAAKKAHEAFDRIDDRFQKANVAIIRDWLEAGTLSMELQSQINQARYQMQVALAGLERATAGAFQAGFETAPLCTTKSKKAP